LPKLKTVKELEETEEWIRKTVKSLVWEEDLKLYLKWIEEKIWDKIIGIIYWMD
jgi:hypothetical protein